MATTALAPRRTESLTTVRDLLEKSKPQLLDALPSRITPDRMARVALTSLRKNPALLDCDPNSILKAVFEAAQLGLEPDGVLGHAYLIPYKTECQLVPGYRGRMDLARRSGEVLSIAVELVRIGDEFDWQLGDSPRIYHKPSADPHRESLEITHVYAIAQLRGGGVQRCVMTRAQIDKHAQRYSAAVKAKRKDSPWNDELGVEWMMRKTVLIQLCKMLPVSVEVQRLYNREESLLYGDGGAGGPQTSRVATLGGLDDLTDRLLGGDDTPDAAADAGETPEPRPNPLDCGECGAMLVGGDPDVNPARYRCGTVYRNGYLAEQTPECAAAVPADAPEA